MRTLLAVARPYRVPLGTAALLAFVLTCKDVTVTPVAVRNVAVTPTDTTLTVGDELTLTAVVTDVAGNRLNDRAVTWSSEDDAVVSVSAAGGVVAVASGEADVTAAVDGRSGTATIHVMDVEEEVASVEVDPDTTSIAIGQTVALEAIARSASGTVLEGRDVSWSSRNETVATVDGEGVVTGASAGEATITATIDSVDGTASVTVTEVVEPVATVEVEPADTSIAVGETIAMKAIARSEDGTVLGGRDVLWASEHEDVATVDAEGVVTGEGVGEATIRATVEGVSETAEVTVSLVPVDNVMVDPAEPSILVGDTVRLEAIALAADGDTLADRAVSWESGDPAVASVDGEGLVTGVAEGGAEITATVEGVSGSTNVTVSLVPVAGVEIVPAEPSVLVGDTVRLQAIALAANGDTLAGRMVAWSSDETAVATVDAQGLVTGIGAGDARINATIENASASATVTVSLVPVASVEVVPADTSLFVGQTVQLAAIARSADGDALEGRDVDWDSRDDDVATVDEDLGLVTAVAVGTARIEAEIEDEEGTATVTVSPVPVESVVVEPADTSIFVDQTVQLAATALDANGDPLDGREVEDWTSNNEAVAIVDEHGLVTGRGAGEATITAQIEDEKGTAKVTVSLVPVAAVAIDPADTTLVEGESAGLHAIVTDENENELTDRKVTWESSNTNVAMVSGTGPNQQEATVTAGSCAFGQPNCNAQITAIADKVSGTAIITVEKVAATVTIATNGPIELVADSTVQLEAEVLASDNTPLDLPVTWTTSDASAATVNDDGTVTGVGTCISTTPTCAAKISATFDDLSDSVEVEVLKPVAAINVEPPTATVTLPIILFPRNVPFNATLTAADATPLPDRSVTWDWSSQAGIAQCPGMSGSGSASITFDEPSGATDGNGFVSTNAVVPPGSSESVIIIWAEAAEETDCATLRLEPLLP